MNIVVRQLTKNQPQSTAVKHCEMHKNCYKTQGLFTWITRVTKIAKIIVTKKLSFSHKIMQLFLLVLSKDNHLTKRSISHTKIIKRGT